MLSDEEKEALRNFKSEYETCDHYSSDLIIELDDAEIILNLIEKQSKEIEELKAINKKLEAIIEKIYNEINSKNKKLAEILDNKKFIDEMWEDKIKAKIEEEDKLFFKTKDVRHANRYKAYKELLEKE